MLKRDFGIATNGAKFTHKDSESFLCHPVVTIKFRNQKHSTNLTDKV